MGADVKARSIGKRLMDPSCLNLCHEAQSHAARWMTQRGRPQSTGCSATVLSLGTQERT
jgi:hypothetical protein